jgi:uracil-DNA glycosylase
MGRGSAGKAWFVIPDLMPERPTLKSLREAAACCRACDLWAKATQTVFGEGPAQPEEIKLFLIGEQPGDKEDKAGRPFVGPAGRVLDEALDRAGIDRLRAYLTNVVKHFAWTPKGKRRIHRKPNVAEISACRPWLDAELEVVRPEVIVCLGATAAQALLGRSFRVTVDRGKVLSWEGYKLVATVHPSSILRLDSVGDPEAREKQMAAFVADLEVAAGLALRRGAP